MSECWWQNPGPADAALDKPGANGLEDINPIALELAAVNNLAVEALRRVEALGVAEDPGAAAFLERIAADLADVQDAFADLIAEES